MANIRIKDLSTTASSTASDDFFGVDGATNGTRKLSAYSPTFGGNLTVSGGTVTSGTGTLTLNSSANTVVLQSAGTTALTLDSSQSATFAGSIKFSNALGDILDSASNRVLRLYSGSLLVSTGATASTGATLQVGGDATFTGVLITQGGTASTPASASATGTAGTIKWDASYIYVCTAANTWKRVAIATW